MRSFIHSIAVTSGSKCAGFIEYNVARFCNILDGLRIAQIQFIVAEYAELGL